MIPEHFCQITTKYAHLEVLFLPQSIFTLNLNLRSSNLILWFLHLPCNQFCIIWRGAGVGATHEIGIFSSVMKRVSVETGCKTGALFSEMMTVICNH